MGKPMNRLSDFPATDYAIFYELAVRMQSEGFTEWEIGDVVRDHAARLGCHLPASYDIVGELLECDEKGIS